MAQLSRVRLGGMIVIVPPSSPRRRYVGSCSPSPLLVYPPTLLLLSGNNLQISLTVSLLHQFIDIKNHTTKNLKYYKNAHTHKTNKIYTHKRVCRRKRLLKGSISLRGSGQDLSLGRWTAIIFGLFNKQIQRYIAMRILSVLLSCDHTINKTLDIYLQM